MEPKELSLPALTLVLMLSLMAPDPRLRLKTQARSE